MSYAGVVMEQAETIKRLEAKLGQPAFERVWEPPVHAGRLISMCNWQDQILIACEFAVFRGWMDHNTGSFKTVEILSQ